jgi:hypothetical protein
VCGVTTPPLRSNPLGRIFPSRNPRTHFEHAQEHGGARMDALIARIRAAEVILTSYDHTTKSQPGLFEVDCDFSKSIAAEPGLSTPSKMGMALRTLLVCWCIGSAGASPIWPTELTAASYVQRAT